MNRTFAIAFCVLGCSSSSPTDDAGTSSPNNNNNNNTNDSGTHDAAPQEAAAEAAPPPAVVNGCTSFTDMTANGATIEGPKDFNPAQFSPNCVRVKAGQSVTFNVEFTSHPLAAFGGDSPNPITTTSSGTTATFMFSNTGTFGFHCLAHPTIMFGAVEVVP